MYGYSSYQTTQIKTADNKQLVIMLYEKAILHLTDVSEQVNSPEFCQSSPKLKKALEIINLLRGGVDFEKGGEIAENLAALYDYLRDIVNEGSINKDISKFKEAISLMSTLLEGWRNALDNPYQPTDEVMSSREEIRPAL